MGYSKTLNLLYSQYGITTSSNLKIKNISKLLLRALEKEQENDLWEYWKLQYPHMDKDNFINFEDYKEKQIQKLSKNINKLSMEEIEKEMNMVENAFSERR